MDDHRNAQTRLLQREALDLVGQSSHVTLAEVRRAGKTGYLADPKADQLGRLGLVEYLVIEDLVRPVRSELRQLLRQRHPAQEIGNARGCVGRRVSVWGLGDHQPFTAPDVRPLTSCRSATM